MLTAAGGAQYTYDALQQRVQKTGGSNPEEVIYFNGRPLALYNPASGAWTDLIWAGDNMLAEVEGNQTAVPVYRLLDHEGSLIATTDGSGNVTGTDLMTPYGQMMTSSTNDPYLYAGLYQDTEDGGDDAWYRNYSSEQSRWLRPDPYNGSYDLNNPQSFNRYSYVENHPLTFTDPSGLAGGVTGWGEVCTLGKDARLITYGSTNPCNPIASVIAYGIANSALDAVPDFIADSIDSGLNSMFGSNLSTSVDATTQQITPFISAAVTIACSIDNFNAVACGGSSGWTSVAFGNGSVASKIVGDTTAVVGATLCASGGPESPGCVGYLVYSLFNSIFSDLWGGPQFTGSLLPRPSDLGGLGTSPTGIPNNNLNVSGILGQPSATIIPTTGP